MLGMFVSFVLVLVFLFAVSGLVSAVVCGTSPIHTVARRIRIAQIVRRESSELDRRYELLLHS